MTGLVTPMSGAHRLVLPAGQAGCMLAAESGSMVVCSASRRRSAWSRAFVLVCTHAFPATRHWLSKLAGPALRGQRCEVSAGTIARAYKLTSPECQGMTMLICADAAMVVDVTDRMA